MGSIHWVFVGATHLNKSEISEEFYCILQLHKYKKQLYGPFLWIGFNCLKSAEPLQGGSLLFTTKFPESPGTHLINLRRMKGWMDLGATQWFWTWDPWIGNPATYPLDHQKADIIVQVGNTQLLDLKNGLC